MPTIYGRAWVVAGIQVTGDDFPEERRPKRRWTYIARERLAHSGLALKMHEGESYDAGWDPDDGWVGLVVTEAENGGSLISPADAAAAIQKSQALLELTFGDALRGRKAELYLVVE